MVAARCAAKRAPAKARLPSARAACLARAPLRLTDTSGPAQTSETSQTARGLSAPVGGRALGLRSEGSWLAAELLRAGLEPGAVDRRAGWTGFCPSNDQPSPRCAPAVPLPARPACAAARTRTSTLPVPPHHRPICPLVSQLTTPVCPHSCRARRGLLNDVLYVFWVCVFCLKMRCIGQNFLPGLRPGPRGRTGPLAGYRVCWGVPQCRCMACSDRCLAVICASSAITLALAVAS